MDLVIVLSKFTKMEQSEKTAEMSFSGFLLGTKIKKIVVMCVTDKIDREGRFLVALKAVRIEGNVLCGELLKIKEIEEVYF